MHPIDSLFENNILVNKIKNRLPKLFQIVDIECSRNGKVGQEVGALREKILIALLMYCYKDQIKNIISPSSSDVDILLNNIPISIKTITPPSKNSISGVKVIWTSDNQRAQEFYNNFKPKTDILLIVLRWGGMGGLYYILLKTQQDIFKSIGKEQYLHKLKVGTNNRGIEYSKLAMDEMIKNSYNNIPIIWKRETLKYNPYIKWIKYWK